MTPAELVLSILRALPSHRVEGKKRLQKLSMLLQVAGCEVDTEFLLHHYGPFSADIADGADELSLFGLVDEHVEPIGVFGTFQTIYSLPSSDDEPSLLTETEIKTLTALDKFSTVALEVASTIAFFESLGETRDSAVAKTIEMKPTRAIPPVLKRTEEILQIVYH